MGGSLVFFEAGLRPASFLMTLGVGCYVCLSDATFVVGGNVCCLRLRLLSEATFAVGGYVQRAAPNSVPPVYGGGEAIEDI